MALRVDMTLSMPDSHPKAPRLTKIITSGKLSAIVANSHKKTCKSSYHKIRVDFSQ